MMPTPAERSLVYSLIAQGKPQREIVEQTGLSRDDVNAIVNGGHSGRPATSEYLVEFPSPEAVRWAAREAVSRKLAARRRAMR